MWSTNFNTSSKQSYYLVKVRHGDRGVGNEQLIEFVLRQMKISISLLAALIFQLYVSFIPYSPSIKNISDVANPFIGSVFVFCFGLFVSSAYTGPYDMIIRSIVHCHFMDEEMFVGDQKFSAVQGTQLTEQGEDENGEQKASSLFAELMGYWKKGADDDNLNAAAKDVKKKEIVKEEMDFDDLYKKVPEGDEDDDNGPSSEEDNGPGHDIFTENKKARLNKDQDFDEDFLKKPEPIKQLAKPIDKPKNTEFEAEAEVNSSMERREKVNQKDLKGLLAEKSDESIEYDQPKPVVVFNTVEEEKKDNPKDLPKPILKNSARFIDDDNKSMKSSISKKRKVEIKENKAENPPEIKFVAEKDDDNKSMKSSKSKFSSKVKLTRKNPDEQKPVIEFKTAPEDLDEETKKKTTVASEEKPPVLSKPIVIFKAENEDDVDKMSSKLSSKSKKTNKTTLKPKDTTLSPERAVKENPQNTLSPEFRVKPEVDDDTMSKKSLRKKIGKSPAMANNSETVLLKDAADDDDKKSAKLSIKSKKSNKNQSMLQPSLERKKEQPTKPAGPDDKAMALLEKLRANRQAKEFKVEDDDFDNVIDKNPGAIKILNASQGRAS